MLHVKHVCKTNTLQKECEHDRSMKRIQPLLSNSWKQLNESFGGSLVEVPFIANPLMMLKDLMTLTVTQLVTGQQNEMRKKNPKIGSFHTFLCKLGYMSWTINKKLHTIFFFKCEKSYVFIQTLSI